MLADVLALIGVETHMPTSKYASRSSITPIATGENPMKMRCVILMALCVLLASGCSNEKYMAERNRREGAWCRSRLTNVLPGAEMLGYTQDLRRVRPTCSATLRFEGKLYAARVDDSNVIVTPMEPMAK